MAVGVGLASKMQKIDRITVCFFGEGAVDEGEFHESLNLAALWSVPVLFICENNRYSMGMPFELAEAETDLVRKAAAYNVKGSRVDGMDVLAVEQATQQAMTYILTYHRPYFLECQTYRYRAHSMFDPERYRTKAEIEEWRARDPIERLADQLMESGELDEKQRSAMEAEVQNEVNAAIDFAEAGTDEPVEKLEQYVYSQEGERV
jgi:pyruvate dehydrogenase E1 component alpha subunit